MIIVLDIISGTRLYFEITLEWNMRSLNPITSVMAIGMKRHVRKYIIIFQVDNIWFSFIIKN